MCIKSIRRTCISQSTVCTWANILRLPSNMQSKYIILHWIRPPWWDKEEPRHTEVDVITRIQYSLIVLHILLVHLWMILLRKLTHLPPDKMAGISADDNFKCIFLNENFWMKFVPRSPIHNKPGLVQVMAWCRRGDKPLPEPLLAQFTDACMRHWAEMG